MKNEKKTINLLIFEPYPFDYAAGNRKTLLNLLKFIDKKSFQIHVMLPFKTSLLDTVRKLGINADVLNFPEVLNQYDGKSTSFKLQSTPKLLLALLMASLKLTKISKKNNIDIIFCNGIRATLICSIPSVLAQVPIVWYVKGRLQNPFLDFVGGLFSKKILFFADVAFNEAHPHMRWFFSKKIDIVPTGVDILSVQAESKKKSDLFSYGQQRVLTKSLTIGYFGQVYKPKGIHILIDAFSKFLKVYPSSQLLIVGASVLEEHEEYMKQLKEQVSALSIDNNVSFTGWRHDACVIMSKLDIIVHPSFAEGFSRVLLEAMCLKKALISTAVGAERATIVNGENGLLVEPNNIGQLVDAMFLLASSAKLRRDLGLNAYKTVKAKHSISTQIHNLEQIFRGL